MAPAPTYPELGKLARDLFRRGYLPGLWQLDCKTKTNSGIEFFTTGYANNDASKVAGSLQSKYKIEDYGLTLTERWNTENILYGEIMQRDKLAEGLMLGIEAQFQPSSGDKNGRFKIGYAQEAFNFLADVNTDIIINASLVGVYQEFLGGVGATFDANNTELTNWKLALGWTNETATVHGEFQKSKSWLASLFYKVTEEADLGIEIYKTVQEPPAEQDLSEAPVPEGESSRDGDKITVGVGCVYRLEGDALVRGKINSNAEVGIGYEQKLREGITFSISAVLEGKNLKDGNHKFGMGFALEC